MIITHSFLVKNNRCKPVARGTYVSSVLPVESVETLLRAVIFKTVKSYRDQTSRPDASNACQTVVQHERSIQ